MNHPGPIGSYPQVSHPIMCSLYAPSSPLSIYIIFSVSWHVTYTSTPCQFVVNQPKTIDGRIPLFVVGRSEKSIRMLAFACDIQCFVLVLESKIHDECTMYAAIHARTHHSCMFLFYFLFSCFRVLLVEHLAKGSPTLILQLACVYPTIRFCGCLQLVAIVFF